MSAGEAREPIHPVQQESRNELSAKLRGLFAAFDDAHVAWCLLRGEEHVASLAGDLDLLVDARDMVVAGTALRQQGFVQLSSARGRGIGGHTVYEAATNRWVRVDIETQVAFGSGRLVTVDVAAAVLARRIRRREAAYPSDDDAFWLLLLHSAWDHPRIGRSHRDRLRRLAGAAHADGVLGVAVQRYADSALFSDEVLELVRAGAWAEVGRLLERLRRRWLARQPKAVTARQLGHHLAARARGLARGLRRPGITVALVGVDGSGKSTMSTHLRDRLPLPVRRIYLGLYSRSSDLEPGLPGIGFAVRVGRLVRASLAAGYHAARGRVIVFDRHTYDLQVDENRGPGRRRRIRRWLLSRLVPEPDVTILLDADPGVLAARKAERTLDELRAARQAYRNFAERKGFVIVDASRSPDEVVGWITRALWRRLEYRLRSRG